MKRVIDSSVAFKWVVPETDSPTNSLGETARGQRPVQAEAVGTPPAGHGFDGSIKRAGRWWRRWHTGLLIVLIVASCLYLFRGPILHVVGGYLVVDEPAAADYAVLTDRSDGCYEWAAHLYHSGSVSGILLLEKRPERLERMGFLPLSTSLSQRELASEGVPRSAVTVIPGETRTDWDHARRLRDWLRGQPGTRLLILCERFEGRRLRYILDKVLGIDYAGRVHLLSLPRQTYDERDWWRNRLGIAHVFDCYVRLVYARLWGEDRLEWRDWDPEDFKRRLR
jgi:hypothetical protein